ncbi:MAG: sensor histidine kinase [Cyanobacteria bacterium J06639_14]
MPSPQAIRPDNHPFPFLLYMEWALLGLAVVSELTPALLPRTNAAPIAATACILGFGALGLWLPRGPLVLRIAHVLGQFSLILLASRAGFLGLRLFPLLYIFWVIRSCLLFGKRGRLLVSGTAFALFFGMIHLRLRSLDTQLPAPIMQRVAPYLIGIRLNLLILFAILLVFVLLLVNALLSERERREELRQANEKLRDSAAQIERLAMAQERSRIAREIHDALGHSLTALNIQLEGAMRLWQGNPEKSRQLLTQAKQMGSTALQDVRQAVATLRETPLQGQDLEAAIATLSQHFYQMSGITPQVIYNCPPLPPHRQVTIYRILQEALTNICKYANASSVNIMIQPSFEPRTQIHITVQDDGQGFDPTHNTTGFGITSMQERAQAEGGQFQLTSKPGAGCRIQVWLPLTSEAT